MFKTTLYICDILQTPGNITAQEKKWISSLISFPHSFWVQTSSDQNPYDIQLDWLFDRDPLEVKDHKKNSPLELLIVNPY